MANALRSAVKGSSLPIEGLNNWELPRLPIPLCGRTDHFQITARDWITTSAAEGGYVAPDPNDPKILYISDGFGSVERFDLRTGLSQNIGPWPVVSIASSPTSTSWTVVADGSIADRKYRAPWTPMLIFSPVDRKTLYLGTQYVMTTTDGGLHWQQITLILLAPHPPDRR